jgi:hypothetical protein
LQERLYILFFSEFGIHPKDREMFIMFNIGGSSTGSSSFSSLVGIGSSRQLEGLEAIIIFVNVSKDTGLKKSYVLAVLGITKRFNLDPWLGG